MLIFNGVDQYIVFSPDFIIRPGSTVTVTIDNTSDATKIYDTNNGDISVVSDTVILSNIDGPVIEIGRNLTDGTFYSGNIIDIAFKNPDQGRVFPELNDNGAVLIHDDPESILTLEFDITIGPDPIASQDIIVLTSDTLFGFKFINSVFTYSEELLPISPQQIPLAANAQYHIKLITTETLIIVEVNSKVVLNIPVTGYTGWAVDFLGEPGNPVSFPVCLSTLHMVYTANSFPNDFVYLLDETSGIDIACSDSNFDTVWDIAEPVTKTLGLINSTYDLGEGSGSALSDNEGNSTGVIQNFNENMWNGGGSTSSGLVQKIRQSIFVLEN